MREFHWRQVPGGGIRIWDREDAGRGAFTQLSTFSEVGLFLIEAMIPLGAYQDHTILLKRVPDSEADVGWGPLEPTTQAEPERCVDDHRCCPPTDGIATLLDRPR